MQGVQIKNGELAEIIQKKLFENHKIIIERGGREGSVIRFLTSLELNKDDIDYIISAFMVVFTEL